MIHENGCAAMTQLALGGSYAKTHGVLHQKEPDEMSTDEIRMVIEWFRQAAVCAQRAGFDGVQIHAAHFFFLSRFISPAVNHRSGEYGGSPLKRAKILRDILKGIRDAVPSRHISVKINSTDGMPGGLTGNDPLEICVMLANNIIDSIEINGNGTSVPGNKPYVDEGYFVPFGKKLAAAV